MSKIVELNAQEIAEVAGGRTVWEWLTGTEPLTYEVANCIKG